MINREENGAGLLRVKYNGKYGTLVASYYKDTDIKAVMIDYKLNYINYKELEYSDEEKTYGLELDKNIDYRLYCYKLLSENKIEEYEATFKEIEIPF